MRIQERRELMTEEQIKREKKKPIQQIRKEKLQEYVSKYDPKDLKYFYFSIDGIMVTAVSLLNRDTMDVSVAFAFCSLKDTFSKVDGKLVCFDRLQKDDGQFTVTIPWVGHSYLSVCAAFNKLTAKPNKLKKSKLDIHLYEITARNIR